MPTQTLTQVELPSFACNFTFPCLSFSTHFVFFGPVCLSFYGPIPCFFRTLACIFGTLFHYTPFMSVVFALFCLSPPPCLSFFTLLPVFFAPSFILIQPIFACRFCTYLPFFVSFYIPLPVFFNPLPVFFYPMPVFLHHFPIQMTLMTRVGIPDTCLPEFCFRKAPQEKGSGELWATKRSAWRMTRKKSRQTAVDLHLLDPGRSGILGSLAPTFLLS